MEFFSQQKSQKVEKISPMKIKLNDFEFKNNLFEIIGPLQKIT